MNKIKKTLFFHAGVPKTGTSSIQKFLYLNRNSLIKHNIDYIFNAQASGGDGGDDIIGRFLVEQEEMSVEQLYKLAMDSQCSRILISDESLFGVKQKNVLKNLITKVISNLNNKGIEVKFIVYLSDSANHICRIWQQYIVGGKRDKFYDKFEIWSSNYSHTVYYTEMLNGLSSIVGNNNIIVRAFEKEQFVKNNLIDDFLNIFNIENNNEFIQLNGNSNTGYNRKTIEMILYIKHYVGVDIYNKPWMGKAFRIINDYYNKQGFGQSILESLTDEQIKIVCDKYYPVECNIAKQFMGREQLFIKKYPDCVNKKRESRLFSRFRTCS